MSTSDDLMNAIRREAERQLSGRYNTRTGLVTAYDPATHSAKVMLKPDNVETGWLPNHTGHIGNGFGVLVGLTPGDGKATGDQVEVTFAEGDLEQGRIIHRLFSDQEKPPPVQSGEILVKHQTGGSMFFSKDNIKITGGKGQADQNQKNPPPTAISKPAAPGSGLDPNSKDATNGQTVIFDMAGKITKTGLKGQTTVYDEKGNTTHTGVKGQTIVADKDGNINLSAKNQDDNTKGNLVATATHDITHTALHNIAETATNTHSRSAGQTITDTAQSLIHNGNTTVAGTLGVSQLLSALGGAKFGANSFTIDNSGNLSSISFTPAPPRVAEIGDMIFRGAVNWDVINPGASGNVLTAQGIGAAPKWLPAGAISTGPAGPQGPAGSVATPATFGAVGDGIANDTVAIQAFINAIPSGGIGLFEAKTYKLNGLLTITASNITINIPQGATLNFTTVGTGNAAISITADNVAIIGGGKIQGPGSGAIYTANEAGVSITPPRSTVTMTIAAPGVVTWTAHGQPAGRAVRLSTTGALPTGISYGVTYYISSASLTINTFSLTATRADAITGTNSITTSGSQSGTHTAQIIYAGMTFDVEVSNFGSYGIYATFINGFRTFGLLYIHDIAFAGMMIASSTFVRIRDGKINVLNAVGTSANAYGLSFTEDTSFADLQIGTPISQSPFCNDVIVFGLTIIGPSIWQALDTHGIYNARFINNLIFGARHGISVTSSSNSFANYAGYNNFILGNTIDLNLQDGSSSGTTPGYGLTLNGPAATNTQSQVIVIGNVIRGYYSQTYNAILATVGVQNYIISNNVIQDWGNSAIVISNNFSGVSICGNIFGDLHNALTANGGSETAGHCILLTGSTANGPVLISGNMHNPQIANHQAQDGVAGDSSFQTSAINQVTMAANDFSKTVNRNTIGALTDGTISVTGVTGSITVALDQAMRFSTGNIRDPILVICSALTGAITITGFTIAGSVGSVPANTTIILSNTDAAHTATVDRTNAVLAGGANFVGGNRSRLVLIKGVTYWEEVSRSLNS